MNELSLFNSLFDNGCFGVPELYGRTTGMLPRVDVKELKDAYVLDMDMPGKTESDVNISLKDNVLTIASVVDESAEKKAEKEEQKTDWLLHERRASEFSRSFTLPKDIDCEAISASVKNGVLTVTIPRKAAPAAKKIAISAA
ncbi:MAG: Hsp20/alpha crystallin family protein [Treponema sp.]|nr:Hsp20/alpha crystallin family protein [Treponema sp.]